MMRAGSRAFSTTTWSGSVPLKYGSTNLPPRPARQGYRRIAAFDAEFVRWVKRSLMRTGTRVSPFWLGGNPPKPDTLKRTDRRPSSTNPLQTGGGHRTRRRPHQKSEASPFASQSP